MFIHEAQTTALWLSLWCLKGLMTDPTLLSSLALEGALHSSVHIACPRPAKENMSALAWVGTHSLSYSALWLWLLTQAEMTSMDLSSCVVGQHTLLL